VKTAAIIENRLFKPALGAALTSLVGLALWWMPLGERWVNASYDYQFRFSTHAVTNRVVIIAMDNAAYDHFKQERGRWDRALHARLLDKLADDGCPLVVLDTFFRGPGDPEKDAALIRALARQNRVALMAEQADVSNPKLESGAQPTLPWDAILNAAGPNWGVAYLYRDLDGVVRRIWPPVPWELYPSLPSKAAQLAGAQPSGDSQGQWLRYYSERDAWISMSYAFAWSQPSNYFRDKIVFIGNEPHDPAPDNEKDEFRTPYTRWRGDSSGGVEILATEFLNLMNGDWLRRPPAWIEAIVLLMTGVFIGGALCRLRLSTAWLLALASALAALLAGVSLAHFTNYWFPWLVFAGGQVPCAIVWAWASPRLLRRLLDIPDYELVQPPFGEGAYGKVWLARNAVGQWQALKVVYAARFGGDSDPYDREFNGIKRYKPVSDKHPGLLRVDFVSTKKKEGFFYYVMELGDALAPGWEDKPSTYRPRDLSSVREQAEGRRLPVRECVRIALTLTEALEFLHQQGLTHRDIKPSNIIFVNSQPKLADVGLVAEARRPDKEKTWVGTPGYMPPAPEPPGTPQADIYGLGMVLYVIRTGRDPALFPEISTTLITDGDPAEFIRLNAIIVKACHPDRAERYASAAEMRAALLELQTTLTAEPPTKKI
jgi:CHASE2 domain-containing sensor protein